MGRKRRRPSREGTTPASAMPRKPRSSIVPWRERSRDILRRLREYARDQQGTVIEEHLRSRLGEEADTASVGDLQQAFDAIVCTPGSAGDARSLVRAFAEETDDLSAEERSFLPTWETERTRRVYLLDRSQRDRLELWDPVAGGRAVIHLIEKMPPARAAALQRGCVILAASVPWGQRRVALGEIEVFEGAEALDAYRREVRDTGRVWHDLPPAAPLA